MNELRVVYREFDLDGSGRVGAEEMLALGQARRKLGQKKGEWTHEMNMNLMKIMGMDQNEHVSMDNFVEYFDSKLPRNQNDFELNMAQFLHVARDLRVLHGIPVLPMDTKKEARMLELVANSPTRAAPKSESNEVDSLREEMKSLNNNGGGVSPRGIKTSKPVPEWAKDINPEDLPQQKSPRADRAKKAVSVETEKPKKPRKPRHLETPEETEEREMEDLREAVRQENVNKKSATKKSPTKRDLDLPDWAKEPVKKAPSSPVTKSEEKKIAAARQREIEELRKEMKAEKDAENVKSVHRGGATPEERRKKSLVKVFRAFDIYQRGQIGSRELKAIGSARRIAGHKGDYAGEWTESKNLMLMRRIDTNGDGKITEEEFVSYFTESLPSDMREFEVTIAQLIEAAKSCKTSGAFGGGVDKDVTKSPAKAIPAISKVESRPQTPATSSPSKSRRSPGPPAKVDPSDEIAMLRAEMKAEADKKKSWKGGYVGYTR